MALARDFQAVDSGRDRLEIKVFVRTISIFLHGRWVSNSGNRRG